MTFFSLTSLEWGCLNSPIQLRWDLRFPTSLLQKCSLEIKVAGTLLCWHYRYSLALWISSPATFIVYISSKAYKWNFVMICRTCRIFAQNLLSVRLYNTSHYQSELKLFLPSFTLRSQIFTYDKNFTYGAIHKVRTL